MLEVVDVSPLLLGTSSPSREALYHFLGYPEEKSPAPRILKRIDSLVLEASELVRPKGRYRLLPFERAVDIGLLPVESDHLAIALVTIGDGVEKRAARYLENNDLTGSLIMDAIGSATVENVADQLSVLLKAGAMCRFSPGYGNWSIQSQHQLLPLLAAEEIGVALNSSALMLPRKSISFAVWSNPNRKDPNAHLIRSGCANCQLKSCLYRKRKLQKTEKSE